MVSNDSNRLSLSAIALASVLASLASASLATGAVGVLSQIVDLLLYGKDGATITMESNNKLNDVGSKEPHQAIIDMLEEGPHKFKLKGS